MAKRIALVGNPNTGKTSLFNKLTGLHQKVGNYPGVTVDKVTGFVTIEDTNYEVLDLPGSYSLFPHSKDEEVVYDTLLNASTSKDFDLILYVLDATNLERNLLFFSQLHDLGLPLMLVVTMNDAAERKGIATDFTLLVKQFSNVPVVFVNPRVGLGMDRLKESIHTFQESENSIFYSAEINNIEINASEKQLLDSEARFKKIKSIVNEVSRVNSTENKVSRVDKWLIHPIVGYVIFFLLLFVMFQMVYSISEKPMEWIELLFEWISSGVGSWFSDGILKSILIDGVLAGLAGTFVFIPQIALLFLFIGLLEESGYMSRAVFLLDRWMKPFGLNGRSVVPLVSSVACAIPGIMASRTIANWKERMITIFVAPLISCSARIPVYILLIGLVIPNERLFGIFHLQAVTLFAMYFLGLLGALGVSLILKWILKTKEKSVFMMELPSLKTPLLSNVFIQIYMKLKTFLFEAGKIIVAISIILWFLSSYGPSTFKSEESALNQLKNTEIAIEDSYIGIVGKSIEPVIQPLGYDWKIGISLLTSFAAREVFVGTMATIYSVDAEEEDNKSLIERMRAEKTIDGKPVYSLATGLSLMVFYTFAMQCMSTLAIVKRETKSWKWPLIQFVFFSVLAYLSALITYQIFS